MSTAYVMGVDFGSTTGKTVILAGDGTQVAGCVSQQGTVSAEGAQASIAGALAQAGLTQDDIAFTVSTGYGRRMLDVSDRSFTEITCHARGAVELHPDVRLVIDIGGQDSKVIAIDDQGLVRTFAMNDRCAAGTGKFFEVLARAMELPIDELGPMAMTAQEQIVVSSMCATFAETEVVSLMAEGKRKQDILYGVHAAVAKRTSGMVAKVGKATPAVMTGGVAKNSAAVQHIEQALGIELQIPDAPQLAGALGAALFALDEVRSQARIREEQEPGEEIPADDRPACQTGCGTNPVAGVALPMAARDLVRPAAART